MLIDFWATWCKPCKRMETSFWPLEEVVEASHKFVCVKLDLDSEQSLAHRFGVSSIPNVVLTDPWGNKLKNSLGFGGDSGVTIAKITDIPFDYSAIKTSYDKLEIDKNDAAALTAIADFYEQKRFFGIEVSYRERLIKLETDAEKLQALLINTGVSYLKAAEPGEAEDCFKRVQKQFPQSPMIEHALFGLIYSSLQKGKVD